MGDCMVAIDDPARGDHPLRLDGEKQFLPPPSSGPSVWIIQNAPKSGRARVCEGW